MGLREDIESDLAETLEASDDYGQVVVLTAPSGAQQTVYGRVDYYTINQDENGNTIIDEQPSVTLRRSSLSPIPASGEKWSFTIPSSPASGSATETLLMDRATTNGKSIGFIQIFLRKAESL